MLYRCVQQILETGLGQCRDGHDDEWSVPEYVEREFRRYRECGIPAHGFARARCATCGHDFLIAFSCKGRGVCPSCNARRMVATAAHLTDQVVPPQPVRQGVLAVPKRLRYFLQRDADLQGAALRLFLRVVEQCLRAHSPGAGSTPRLGAVVFIHRFGWRAGSTPTPSPMCRRVRRRLLRWFVRRDLLSDDDARAMALRQHGGGLSVDASARIATADRAGGERLLRNCARPPLALDLQFLTLTSVNLRAGVPSIDHGRRSGCNAARRSASLLRSITMEIAIMQARYRRHVAAALAASALAIPGLAAAQNSPWMTGVRALGIYPNDSSSNSGLSVKEQWTGEANFTYFFNKNFASELILSWAKHEVQLNGADLGKVGVLPPTLTLQYHFTDLGAFKPYVGGGFNYTYFYERDLANDTLEIGRDSWGGALQVGMDYMLDRNWSVNFDVKYVWMDTDVKVKATGANLGSVDIDPWLLGIGVRYCF